jgi:endoglucanase
LHTSCKPDPPSEPELKISTDNLEFESEGGEQTFQVTSSLGWNASAGQNWLTLSPTSKSTEEVTTITVKAAKNTSRQPRTATISVRGGAGSGTVTVTQKEAPPVPPPPPAEGMDDDAVAMAAKMGRGWNLGNTLEPPLTPDNPWWQGGEGSWTDGAKATRELIQTVAAAGFKNIRIPCTWDSHIIDRTTNEIDPGWLDRVAEVVGWCLDEGLYTTINTHHEGWLQEHPFYANQAANNAKLRTLWEQIATRMKDFDQRLTFAGTNEVQVNFGAPTTENIEVQESYNQTFVDAVRSTGGKNAWRNLIVQAYNTSIDNAVTLMTLPEDIVEGRLFVEVHYYDPYEFSIMKGDDSGVKLVWGNRPQAPVPGSDGRKANWGDETFADTQFAKMKTHFVDAGIPVIVGEYGGTFRTGLGADQADHDASNIYYLGYLTRAMLDHGLIPVYWDNGTTSPTPEEEGSGLFDRKTYAVAHPEALEAIITW